MIDRDDLKILGTGLTVLIIGMVFLLILALAAGLAYRVFEVAGGL